MKILAPCDKFRAVDSNGDALVGGLLYTSTTGADWPANALATYSDATGNSANTNPIVLDARGEADIFLTPNLFYRFVLKTAAGVLIRTVDQVGYNIGYLNIPQTQKSANYTTTIDDAGTEIQHPIGDNNARTFTIDSNANVPYAIGTAITFGNLINTVTIAITDDTMYLAGAGTTGSRTLAAKGICTAVKQTATTWLISGVGLT